MNALDKKALVKTITAAARALWFGFLGLVVVILTTLATSGDISNTTLTVAGFTVNLSVIILAVIGFVAKAVDNYVHENENIDSNGIAPRFLQR